MHFGAQRGRLQVERAGAATREGGAGGGQGARPRPGVRAPGHIGKEYDILFCYCTII